MNIPLEPIIIPEVNNRYNNLFNNFYLKEYINEHLIFCVDIVNSEVNNCKTNLAELCYTYTKNPKNPNLVNFFKDSPKIIKRLPKYKRFIEISGIYTYNHFQRMGLANYLLDYVLSKYENAIYYLKVQSFGENKINHEILELFYKKHGFVNCTYTSDKIQIMVKF